MNVQVTSPIAVIPMRAGSKGVKNKNTRMLCGDPLYMHSVRAARAAGIQQIIITTDIPSVIRNHHDSDITIVERPKPLAEDTSTMAPVINHTIKKIKAKGCAIVLLQPTSPLRTGEDILESYELYARNPTKLVMSVCEIDRTFLKGGTVENGIFMPICDGSFVFKNRAELPSAYKPNGAIYIFGSDWFLENQGFNATGIVPYIMGPDRSIDIDNESDFTECEKLLSKATKE